MVCDTSQTLVTTLDGAGVVIKASVLRPSADTVCTDILVGAYVAVVAGDAVVARDGHAATGGHVAGPDSAGTVEMRAVFGHAHGAHTIPAGVFGGARIVIVAGVSIGLVGIDAADRMNTLTRTTGIVKRAGERLAHAMALLTGCVDGAHVGERAFCAVNCWMAAANMLNGVAEGVLTTALAAVYVFDAAILFSMICAAPVAGSNSTGIARHTVGLR